MTHRLLLLAVSHVLKNTTHLTILFQDLENYILELIPTLPQLNCLEESFYSFYVCTAVRKFFFFLDPLRTGVFCVAIGGRATVYVGLIVQVSAYEYCYDCLCVHVLVCLWLSYSPPPGKIKIQDILACGFLDDLLEVSQSTSKAWF